MNANNSHQSANRSVPAGTRLNGIYEIDRMIGSGGMGEIYKGHEIQTGTSVAIKMLLPEMAENEAALGLFRKEASALHYLMHDAIVRYFVFTVEPVLQRPYLAMEFVDGLSLAELLEHGPLTHEALLRLIRRVASGLNAAHGLGIIHRDVSPDNIIAPQSDVARAKIIDFGIARSTQLGDATIIGTGFAGKHNYVSPEQIGLYGGDVGAKSDVYSFGLVVFHALTGVKLDMGGSQFQLVEKRRRPPDLGAVDAHFRPLLEKMLQPDPSQRATMAEVENWSSDKARLVVVQPIDRGAQEITPPSAASQTLRPRFRLGLLTGGAVLVSIGVALAYYQYVWKPPVLIGTAPPPSPDLLGMLPSPPTRPAPPADKSQTEVVSKKPEAPIDNTARGDLIRQFVQRYDGGDCFFVTPVAVSANAAVIEGFGASIAPFDLLDQTFKTSQGFEASIGVRLVRPAQCPAITFLNQIGGSNARTPRISIESVKARPGEAIAGTVGNFSNRVVELLLISDDGQVRNLSYLLKPGTDALGFSIEIPRGEIKSEAARPQLVMAVTSPRVLDSLRQPQPTAADQFFLQVTSEAQRANVMLSTSARYFTIQK